LKSSSPNLRISPDPQHLQVCIAMMKDPSSSPLPHVVGAGARGGVRIRRMQGRFQPFLFTGGVMIGNVADIFMTVNSNAWGKKGPSHPQRRLTS
jgi:hypothetical protein